ncbi:MAG: hypothetical protein ACLRZZ_28500 [Enterocloster sp.]
MGGCAKKACRTGPKAPGYAANGAVIEAAAKQHGKSSSNNGWWIYPGTVPANPVIGEENES